MKPKPIKLVELKAPRETVKMVHERVLPFMEKYNHEQMVKARMLYDFKGKIDLKWLAISCYTQGLMDAQQLKTDKPKAVKSRRGYI